MRQLLLPMPMRGLVRVIAWGCAAGLLMAATPAMALCVNGSKTVFACNTARDKRLEVCEAHGVMEYSFGSPQGRPEIVLRMPRAQASQSQWSTARQWYFHTLDVPNGSTTYNIFWSSKDKSSAVAQEGGVNVVVGDTVTATVLCVPQTIVLQSVDVQSVASSAR